MNFVFLPIVFHGGEHLLFLSLFTESKHRRQLSKINRGRSGPWGALEVPKHREPSGNLLYYRTCVVSKHRIPFFRSISFGERGIMQSSFIRLILCSFYRISNLFNSSDIRCSKLCCTSWLSLIFFH